MTMIEGISSEGGPGAYLALALILGLANATIGPILKVLKCPLIMLTLGLFTLVINGLMLWLASTVAFWLEIDFTVDGFGAAFLGAIVISVVSFALTVLTGVNRKERDRDRR